MRAALSGLIGGLLAAPVTGVGAAVVGGIGVHDFAIEAGFGDAEAIAFAGDRSGVDNRDDKVFGIFAAAEKGKNAIVGIVGVDRCETVPVKIDFMKSRFSRIEVIEVGDKLLDAAMRIPLERVPIEAVSFAPFVALGDFLAHEEELFAGMSVLISVEKTEVGELLPHIAGHFVEKGVFAVDDFVVREGKKEIFGEGVEKGERELVVLVLAMNGVAGKVVEGVVHPAHVPFEAEAEAAQIIGARDGGPGSG